MPTVRGLATLIRRDRSTVTAPATDSDDPPVAHHPAPVPWDTPDVGNTNDSANLRNAHALHQRAGELSAEYDQTIADRNAAMKAAWTDDGVTQEAIARTVGISIYTLKKIFSGKARSERS